MKVNKIELLHHVLIGSLVSAPVVSLTWLITGSFPPFLVTWSLSMAALMTAHLLVKRRRWREVEELREMYDRPPHSG